MVIDYSSEGLAQEKKEEANTSWNDLAELVKAGKIYGAIDVVNRSIQQGKDEIESRLYLARLLEKGKGEYQEYALDQFELILDIDPGNMDAIAGKTRIIAETETDKEIKKEPEKPYDEEEDILQEMASMAMLPPPKSLQACMGSGLLFWGSGLILLGNKIGFIVLGFQFFILSLLLNGGNKAAFFNALWLKMGLGGQKYFDYSIENFTSSGGNGLLFIGILIALISLYFTYSEVIRSNSSGQVIRMDGDNCFINLGENRDIVPGSIFTIVKLGLLKSKNGKVQKHEFAVGRVKIEFVRKLYSKGVFHGFRESTQLPEKNDRSIFFS